MLVICTFLWGDKYGPEYVARWASGLRRHLAQPHRLLVLTERERAITLPEGIERHAIKDPELTRIKGCFARLRLFDPGWQANRGIHGGDRLVCIDLDVVVTGALDPLFDRDEPFVILQGANAKNPCPYNGSIWMLRGGYRPDVWQDFSIAAAERFTKVSDFADDQGWFEHKLPNAAAWKAGDESGVYAFKKPGWPEDSDELPVGARLVCFIGWRKPSAFTGLGWVRENWAA